MGYGEYYHHDRDWGTHENISTFIDILEYGEEIGRNKLSERFDADIIAMLETSEIGLEKFGAPLFLLAENVHLIGFHLKGCVNCTVKAMLGK